MHVGLFPVCYAHTDTVTGVNSHLMFHNTPTPVLLKFKFHQFFYLHSVHLILANYEISIPATNSQIKYMYSLSNQIWGNQIYLKLYISTENATEITYSITTAASVTCPDECISSHDVTHRLHVSRHTLATSNVTSFE